MCEVIELSLVGYEQHLAKNNFAIMLETWKNMNASDSCNKMIVSISSSIPPRYIITWMSLI
jgi:hypothetical protein